MTGLAVGGFLTLPWNISLHRPNDIIILAPIVARLFKTNHIIVLIFYGEVRALDVTLVADLIKVAAIAWQNNSF